MFTVSDAVKGEEWNQSSEYISENILENVLNKEDPEKTNEINVVTHVTPETPKALEEIVVPVHEEMVVNCDEPVKNKNTTKHKIVNLLELPNSSCANYSSTADTKFLKMETNVLKETLNKNEDDKLFYKGTKIVLQDRPQICENSNLELLGLLNTDALLNSRTLSTESSGISEALKNSRPMQIHTTSGIFSSNEVKKSTKREKYIGSSKEVKLDILNKKEPQQKNFLNVEFATKSSRSAITSSAYLNDNEHSSFKETTKPYEKGDNQNISLNKKSVDKLQSFLKFLNLDLKQFKKVEKEINCSKLSHTIHERACSSSILRSTKSKNIAHKKNTKCNNKNKKKPLTVSRNLFGSIKKINRAEGLVLDSSNHRNASNVPNRQIKCVLNKSFPNKSSCIESQVITHGKKAFPNLKSKQQVKSENIGKEFKGGNVTTNTGVSCHSTSLDLPNLSRNTKLNLLNQSDKHCVGVPQEICYTGAKKNENQQCVKKNVFYKSLGDISDQKNNGLAGRLVNTPVSCANSSVASSNNSQTNIILETKVPEESMKMQSSVCDSTEEFNKALCLDSSSDEDSVPFWDSDEKSSGVVRCPSEVSRIIILDEDEEDSISQGIYN